MGRCLATHATHSICSSEQLQRYSSSYQTCMKPEGSLLCKQQSLTIAGLSQINPITISHLIDLRSILILLSHALLDVPSYLLNSIFYTEKLQTFLFASLLHARTFTLLITLKTIGETRDVIRGGRVVQVPPTSQFKGRQSRCFKQENSALLCLQN